jgi:two-component system, LytTR family, sensor kinase
VHLPNNLIQAALALYERRWYNFGQSTGESGYLCEQSSREIHFPPTRSLFLQAGNEFPDYSNPAITMNKWLTYENIWARNIIFGSLLFALISTQTKLAPNVPGITVPNDIQMVGMFVMMYIIIFMHNHFAVRQLLLTQKYQVFIPVFLGFMVLSACMSLSFDNTIGFPISYISQALSAFMTLFMGTAIYFSHTWILNNIVKTKIELLNKEAEITFLKQQLSPHFLFNAINNLYGTALSAPEIITDKILELSDLLRYQVEATTKNRVNIVEERIFVDNYINYTTYKSNDLVVTNQTEGTVQPYQIPPLLFLPLLENAIKYSSETENAFIHILWMFNANQVIFQIKNSYLSEGSSIKGTKVGLDNLQKRLALLNIKHTLTIDQHTPNIYKTELTLWQLPTNV